MTRLKLILLTLIILCLGTFIVLNTQTVELNLLFAKVNMSRSVILPARWRRCERNWRVEKQFGTLLP